MTKTLYLERNFYIKGDWIVNSIESCKYTRGWLDFHPLKKILKYINENPDINSFTNGIFIRQNLEKANKLNYSNEPNKKEFLEALNQLEKNIEEHKNKVWNDFNDENY